MPQTAVLELTNLRKTIKGKEIVKGVNLTLYTSLTTPPSSRTTLCICGNFTYP